MRRLRDERQISPRTPIAPERGPWVGGLSVRRIALSPGDSIHPRASPAVSGVEVHLRTDSVRCGCGGLCCVRQPLPRQAGAGRALAGASHAGLWARPPTGDYRRRLWRCASNRELSSSLSLQRRRLSSENSHEASRSSGGGRGRATARVGAVIIGGARTGRVLRGAGHESAAAAAAPLADASSG